MKVKTALILALVVLLLILVIQNSALIEFRLLFWPLYLPIFILVIGVFAAGLIVGYLAARTDRKKESKPLPRPSGTPELKAPPAAVPPPKGATDAPSAGPALPPDGKK